MTPDEQDALQRKCDMYELLYLRATEGARAANRGIERLRWKLTDAEADLKLAKSQIARMHREVGSLEKKVQRLSLRLIHEWGNRR